MATSAWPHWLVRRVVARISAGAGNLNPEHLAAELEIEEDDVIALVYEARWIIGTLPVLYTTRGTH
ncbi:hypothetical protein LXA47_03800 [Massilia sp. P8910]|uniref:hypothetical protein n=1 Tax=Massilia antarctica TaxID=2765360 RepID=UPI001E565572|nr:hypothetical protein [Massilia antarctica]MCE3602722.1 hypothetical protein [Massilia antarctica]